MKQSVRMAVCVAAAVLTLTVAVAQAVAGIGVTNVTATPRWPWNGKVDIAYEVLADDPATNLWVSFGGRDVDRNVTIPMRTLAGDGADGRVKPGKRRVTWDAAADSPGANAAAFAVTVSVSAGEKYLVIDLSGGTNAVSYPVTYLGDVPSGGWTDEYKTTKLVLRRVPAGAFTMGSPEGELGRVGDETQHEVTLTTDFYIGVFEVTQRQWDLVMGDRPSFFTNATYRDSRPVEYVSYYDIRENPANSDAPAVNWPANSTVNADSFMGKLRAKTGHSTFDLPTESQWEYACRAGTGTALNSGYDLTDTQRDARMAAVGRYGYNGGLGYSQGCATNAGTAAAGSYLPNAWGLYDMHGNEGEWCLDWYGTYPGAVTDTNGAVSGVYRVHRSGHFTDIARICRSASRNYNTPDYRYRHIGLRVAALPAVR